MNLVRNFVLASSEDNISNGAKVTFPHMGDYHLCFKAALEILDCEAVVPPPITKRTIELGCKYSPEFACFPFKITLGSLIEGLEQGADILIQSGRDGSCRYGYYKQVQEKILKDLGYRFRFVRLDSIRSIKTINKNASYLQVLKGLRIAWLKMKVIEKFESLVRKLSASEINIGESRRLYRQFLNACNQANTKFQINSAEKEFLERFDQIRTISNFKPLKIGIVGELYIVMEPYGNLDIERELNQRGVEVIRPLCLSQILKEMLPWSPRKTAFRRIARPYLRYESGAHASVSVAETIIFAREGLDGVIHIKPHACMPEVTAMGALYKVSRDYDIPVLFFSFDEHASSVGVKTRLEAFVELLKRRRDRNVSRHRCRIGEHKFCGY